MPRNIVLVGVAEIAHQRMSSGVVYQKIHERRRIDILLLRF